MSYPEFTKEMKKTHTILVPNMLPIHFGMIEQVFNSSGYRVKLLKTTDPSIVEEGLKHVHNDTCYPALLTIGQMISALKSGQYDVDKTALLLTQTGGGCRASNYISLLRKALVQCGLPQVPVISLNFSNLEKNSGFTVNLPLIAKAMYAINYGDLIMWLSNQCRPYELCQGQTKALVQSWSEKLCKQLKGLGFLNREHNYKKIIADFAAIPRSSTPKIQVGIVGEIYMKYSPLGNNHLEDFLIAEGAEPIVTGLMDFCMYCVKNNLIDFALYGGDKKKYRMNKLILSYLQRWQDVLIEQVKKEGTFRAPTPFSSLEEIVTDYIGMGAKMGEGWLLTAETVEFIASGVPNVVCTQPFGCLPNHIVAKGMMRKIKDNFPQSNVVAIDYDPGATAINQENRLKLMLSNAKLSEKI